MIILGFLWFGSKEEIEIMDDIELYEDKARKTALKRLAIESVIGMISRTIIQSEFRIKQNKKYLKNEMYYRFNVKPNVNQSAATFWNQVINKLIYNGECLIIKTDTDDLLVADNYTRAEFAIYQDSFRNVIVKGYEFKRTYKREEVLFFEYGNDKLSKLIDSLFYDYGELLGRLIEFQLRKHQIRSTVDVDSAFGKGQEATSKLQRFIDRTYKAIKEKAIAIIPQQKGLTYTEHSSKQNTSGTSVDEINKITNGFMDQVANAVGMPLPLLRGDMADIEKITRNYMKFCIDPILKILEVEMNMQFISQSDFTNDKKIIVRRVAYRDMFDLAVAVDKLRSSSVVDGNELRDALGLDPSDDPIMDEFILTKNYQKAKEALEGGEE
ncbi:phage portal protein [Bacillus niameyensis]|uniref:phage portal protein n=1 Tax=Bacillus niameyensis TaxID=1522308 RepID=UPI0008411DD5|nr:phage portal protein [Bacillus niameyensis]